MKALSFGCLLLAAAVSPAADPLRLHPDNSHYFLFRGRPTVLIGSTEHYGHLARTDVYALKDSAMTETQVALVRKLVEELRDFDNLYYEICNEPYFGGVTLPWQARIAEVIAAAESQLPGRHLIAQNIANGAQQIDQPNPRVSIFNFHYATPPDAVALNFSLERPIGDDETGFRGSDDAVYHAEGWNFLLAGGGLYDNLDYSFTTEHEDGTATPHAPGGGGRTLRRQLGVLKRFIESFDFLAMRPDKSLIVGGVPDKATGQALAHPGKAYAIYLAGGTATELQLKLAAGDYRVEWLNPRTGKIDAESALRANGDVIRLRSPPYEHDIALAIRRREVSRQR